MVGNFDKRFLLLVFPLLRTAWPRVQYLGREVLPFALIVLFIVSFVGSRPPSVPQRVRVSFWIMLFCFAVFAGSDNLFAIFSYGEFLAYHEYATLINALAFLCAFYIAIIHRKFNELKILFLIVLIGLIIAGFSAASSGEITSRQLLLNSVSRENFESQYRRYDAVMAGLGGYGFVYATAMCSGLMLLVAFSRSLKKRFRVVASIVFILMLVIVKKGGLGTAVAVASLSIILSTFSIMGRSVRFLKMIGLLACTVFFVYASAPQILSPFSKPLMSLANSMNEGDLRVRVASAAQSLGGDKNSYAYERAQLFIRSMNVFLENPIFGVGAYDQGTESGDKLGGHSAVMDMLARQGLIGLFLIFMFFSSAFKFFREVSIFCRHPNWNVVPTIYLLCTLYAMFSNQLAKNVSGLFLIIAFGHLAMLMQTNPGKSNHFRRFERWKI